MVTTSRRSFIQKGATLASMAALTPLMVQSAKAAESVASTKTPYQKLTSATTPYVPVRILDTENMPWPPPFNDRGWKAKTLFENDETGDHLVIIEVPIGAPGGRNHYHDFHEWVYWLSGDFVNNEYTSPLQRTGPFQQFREGIFLDRPPYSLHGGEIGRLDSQVGGTCLIMEEGGETNHVIPGDDGYNDEWKKVKQWSVPRIIDTLSEMPWEAYESANGVLIKRLVNDQVRGFRATLWQIPQGWSSSQAPGFARAYYYKQAHQFNFVLNGDMRIQTYKAPGKKAEEVTLGKSFYFERVPMSIMGLADGVVSTVGCVWLEVTYGKGTAINNVPIEEPSYI
jgi:hypothetical protein